MTREEAIERIKSRYDKWALDDKDLEAFQCIFPELRESEDERIRKALIHLINEQDGFLTAINGISVKDIIAYLERQKEQKPSEQKYESDNFFKTPCAIDSTGLQCPYKDLALVKDFFGKYKRKCKLSNMACVSKECKQWNELQAEFKRINEAFENGKNEVINRPEAFGLQKSAEWSEEDENKLHQVMEVLLADKTIALRENPRCKALHRAYDELLDWLKSLRPQWKPSEEQMKWLKDVIETVPMTCRQQVPLESLYADLQKLLSHEIH